MGKGRPFLPGNPGRPAGSRNKLQAGFLEALAKDFEEHGQDVIQIVRLERPNEYLRIIAGILPKEFLVTDTDLADVTDEELKEALEWIRHRNQTESGNGRTLS